MTDASKQQQVRIKLKDLDQAKIGEVSKVLEKAVKDRGNPAASIFDLHVSL